MNNVIKKIELTDENLKQVSGGSILDDLEKVVDEMIDTILDKAKEAHAHTKRNKILYKRLKHTDPRRDPFDPYTPPVEF